MGWTTPNAARATGYLVTAGNWNELALDLQYLKGQAGTVAIEAGATFAGDVAISSANGQLTITRTAVGSLVAYVDSSNRGRLQKGGVEAVALYNSGGVYVGASPSDPGANNLQVQGDIIGPNLKLRADSIERYDTDDDSQAVSVNYFGYNGGSTRFRDFNVYNGKTSRIAGVDGSSGGVLGAWAPRTFVPAEAMYTAGIAGTWAEAALEATDTAISTETRKFDASTDEKVEFKIRVPANYAGGSITIKVQWFANATSGNVVWDFQATTVASGGNLGTAVSSRGTVTAATNGTANRKNEATITWSSSLPAAGDELLVLFKRDADNGSDTLAVDAELLDLMIEWGS